MNEIEKMIYYVKNIGISTTLLRIINRYLGKLLVARRPTEIADNTYLKLINGKKFKVNPNDKGFSIDIILGKGVREPLATKYLIDHLPNMKTFLDIGSNIGYYTILLADKFEHIVALEPLKENFDFVIENVELNGLKSKVSLENKALSADGGQVRIESHKNRNWARISDNGELVRSITLEELAKKYGSIDFIKMDVEGYEKNIILNNKEWFASDGPKYFFFEHHMDIFTPAENVEILTVLQEAGYEIDVAFYEINPPIEWGIPFMDRFHNKILELSLRPKRPIMYKSQPIKDVINDTLVLDGRYGSVEFILKCK